MPPIDDGTVIRIDSTIAFVMENKNAWDHCMIRTPRMYPARGGDIVALFDQFLTYIPEADWSIYTIADFAVWLKTRTLPTHTEAVQRSPAAQKTTAKIDLTDQRQQQMLGRIKRIEDAKTEYAKADFNSDPGRPNTLQPPSFGHEQEREFSEALNRRNEESRRDTEAKAAMELELAKQKDGDSIPDNATIPEGVIAPDPFDGL